MLYFYWNLSPYNYLTCNNFTLLFSVTHTRMESLWRRELFFVSHLWCPEQYLPHVRGSVIFADWMINKWMNVKAERKYKIKKMIFICICTLKYFQWNMNNLNLLVPNTYGDPGWANFSAPWFYKNIQNLSELAALKTPQKYKKKIKTKVSGECEQWEKNLKFVKRNFRKWKTQESKNWPVVASLTKKLLIVQVKLNGTNICRKCGL